MIKFFRHIRQRLLSENRFSKYLLYAIGEIILVVIGILIALQINNWNEEQKMDRWEQQFLENLQNELKGNHSQLKHVMDVQNKKGQAMELTLDLLQNADKNDQFKIDSLYSAAQINPTFFPTTGVYDSGVSSGKIDELKNDALKFKIMNLYGHFYRRTVYNGEVLDDVVAEVDRKEFRFFDRTGGKMKSWEEALGYEFKSIITEELKQNTVYTIIAQYTLDELEQLIERVSKELKHEDIPKD